MLRTKWFYLIRQPGEVECNPAAVEAVAVSAERADLELDAREPRWGWVTSRHSRDGRAYPCLEFTDGAEPAWLWLGRPR